MRLTAIACAAALLAGCAGHALQAQNAFLPTTSATGTGTLRLRVRTMLRSHDVSPSAKGIDVTIVGPTKYHKEAGLTINALGCHSTLMTLECTLEIPGLKYCKTKAPCYIATVTTYDKYDPATKRIPPGAHILSREQKFAFSIRATSTMIPLVLEGIPASIAFVPSPGTSLTGSQNAGFVEPKCSRSVQSVMVIGLDSDGNYILGAGAPKIAVHSATPSQLAAAHAGGNTFELVPPAAPAYAYGNFTTQLALSATPGSKSGGKPVATTVNVTYSGQICGTIDEFAVPTAGSEPIGMAAGGDGNMWFTELLGSKVGRISLAGAVSEFPVPTASAEPVGITAGADGALWVAEFNVNKIAKVSTSGSILEFPTPTSGSEPFGVTAGPNGNVWFTEASTNKIGEVSDGGLIAEFAVPAGSTPTGITVGPDGNVWFTDNGNGKIGMITPTGTVSSYAIPNGASGQPLGIASVAGAVWFSECKRNFVGRIETDGTVVPQYQLPEPTSSPGFATVGPDGAFWFSEQSGNRIGRISPEGTFTEYAIPTVAAYPLGLAVGPDGAIWFAEGLGDKIARLR